MNIFDNEFEVRVKVVVVDKRSLYKVAHNKPKEEDNELHEIDDRQVEHME